MRLNIGVAQDEDPTKAATNAVPDLCAEVEREEFSVKGRAQAVVACRPA
jgi:hypothetical protein